MGPLSSSVGCALLIIINCPWSMRRGLCPQQSKPMSLGILRPYRCSRTIPTTTLGSPTPSRLRPHGRAVRAAARRTPTPRLQCRAVSVALQDPEAQPAEVFLWLLHAPDAILFPRFSKGHNLDSVPPAASPSASLVRANHHARIISGPLQRPTLCAIWGPLWECTTALSVRLSVPFSRRDVPFVSTQIPHQGIYLTKSLPKWYIVLLLLNSNRLPPL